MRIVKKFKRKIFYLLALIVLAGGWLAKDNEIISIGGGSEYNEEYSEYKFRSSKQLKEHYESHGIEMGFDSAEDYERAASDVINNPNALSKTEKEDGDFVFYLKDTNEIVFLSTDGYIRSYFCPDAGISYYNKQ